MDYKVGDKVKVVSLGREVFDYNIKNMKASKFFVSSIGKEYVQLTRVEGPFIYDTWNVGPECIALEDDGDNVPVEKEQPKKGMFKVGDKVLCVDAANKLYIKQGEIYEVVYCNKTKVRVINRNKDKCQYNLERFKKATPAIIKAYEAKIQAQKQAAIAAKAAKEAAEKKAKDEAEKLAKQAGFAALRAKVMKVKGGCAVYCIQDDTGKFDHGTTACHAGIGGYGVLAGQRIALAENINIQHAKAVLHGYGDQYKRFANYVINESPVRDCFIPQGIDNGLMYGVLYNTNRPIEELVVAANMLREGGEFAGERLKLFGELLDKGFSGKVAYLLSYCVASNMQYRGFCNAHKCMANDMDAEGTFKFFREGFYLTKDKKPYNKTHGGYSGIAKWMAKRDAYGDEKPTHLGVFMKKALKVEEGGGGFGRGGAVVTEENLLSFAVVLESLVTQF